MMHIITARHLGMCGGVRRALRRARAIADPRGTTIKGEIVHNARVNAEMVALGFTVDSEQERDRIPETPAVLITAHGTSDHMRAHFRQAGKVIRDATCPLVHGIHTLAMERAHQGYFIILIGRPGHAEVRGIVEDLARYAIVDSADQVGSYAAGRLAVLCQSTTSPNLAAAIVRQIQLRNPHAFIQLEDTICGPTRRRQAAVYELLDRIDLLVVVGDRGSNNARGLAELASAAGVRSLLLSHPEDLDERALRGCETLGLTAGASTPDELIYAVRRRLVQAAPGRTRSAFPHAAPARAAGAS